MSSNYPPDFDHDVDSGAHEDCLSINNAQPIFTFGLQAMREAIARGIEAGTIPLGPSKAADAVRQTWGPQWGPDPGRPDEVADEWDDYL